MPLVERDVPQVGRFEIGRHAVASAEVLGVYLDAILAGANEFDASDIANVIERRPRPSYEERVPRNGFVMPPP
jgi:hypothetical protein